MLSARTRWDRTPNRLSLLLDEKRRRGAVILDLTESNPTRVGIEAPADLLSALAETSSLRYEPAPLGWLPAREAVAADFGRRGFEVDADEIVLTASTSEAYSFLIKLLCDPGDAILAPRPSYPLFEYLAALESVGVEQYPLTYEGEWHLDPEALAAAVSPRTRAVILVNPGNPTGSYLKADEVRALLDLCASRGLALISDEVFADYPFGPDPRRVVSLAGAGPVLTFCLGGLSKSCGLPQLKLGWIAVGGPPALRAEALARLEIVADTYLSVGTPVQRALPGLLARRAELGEPIAARVRRNLEALGRRLDGTSSATLLRPEGGWSAVLRVPATIPEEEQVLRLLEKDDVLVHPGYFFDFPSEAFLVLSLLPSPEVFDEGIERIVAGVG